MEHTPTTTNRVYLSQCVGDDTDRAELERMVERVGFLFGIDGLSVWDTILIDAYYVESTGTLTLTAATDQGCHSIAVYIGRDRTVDEITRAALFELGRPDLAEQMRWEMIRFGDEGLRNHVRLAAVWSLNYNADCSCHRCECRHHSCVDCAMGEVADYNPTCGEQRHRFVAAPVRLVDVPDTIDF